MQLHLHFVCTHLHLSALLSTHAQTTTCTMERSAIPTSFFCYDWQKFHSLHQTRRVPYTVMNCYHHHIMPRNIACKQPLFFALPECAQYAYKCKQRINECRQSADIPTLHNNMIINALITKSAECKQNCNKKLLEVTTGQIYTNAQGVTHSIVLCPPYTTRKSGRK